VQYVPRDYEAIERSSTWCPAARTSASSTNATRVSSAAATRARTRCRARAAPRRAGGTTPGLWSGCSGKP